jgi:uncharacterized membrane protein
VIDKEPLFIVFANWHGLCFAVCNLTANLKDKIMRATNTIRTETVENTSAVKDVALFLVAPFIGLAYAVLLPLVGIVMLLLTAGKALVASAAMAGFVEFVKLAAKLVAAPFVGLIFAVSFPFVGIAMIVWAAVEALAAKLAKAEVFGSVNIAARQVAR